MVPPCPIRRAVVATPPPDEAIFVAFEDGRLCRFTCMKGWSEWTVRTPGILVDAPLVLADRIIQIVPDNGTWVVGRVRGNEMWRDPAILHYLGQSKDKTRMYFFDGKGLVVKNPTTGQTLASAPVRGGGVIPVPDPDGTRLYLFSAAGEMLCLNDPNLPYLVVNPR